MIITVSEINNPQEKPNKIATFYDESCYAAIFIQKLIDEAYEDGNTKILVDVDFPEYNPFGERINL